MSALVVHDVMSAPIETISMDDTVERIQGIFETSYYHHLIVHGDRKEAVGVISDRDLLKNVSPFVGKMGERNEDRSLLNRRAHQIMTRQLIAVRANTALRSAARVMLDHRISCLPVVDSDGHCIGIVTLRDVVRWAVDELEHTNSGSNTKAA
jgi:acetoin utilization protein AcuB